MAVIPITNLSSKTITLPGGYYVKAVKPGETVEVTVENVDAFIESSGIQDLINNGYIRIRQQTPDPYFVGTVSYAGGGTSTTVTVYGVEADDILVATLMSSTNAVYLTGVKRTAANTVTISFSADPGASTVVSLVAYAA